MADRHHQARSGSWFHHCSRMACAPCFASVEQKNESQSPPIAIAGLAKERRDRTDSLIFVEAAALGRRHSTTDLYVVAFIISRTQDGRLAAQACGVTFGRATKMP